MAGATAPKAGPAKAGARKPSAAALKARQRLAAYEGGLAGDEEPADSAPQHVHDGYALGKAQAAKEQNGDDGQDQEETEETPAEESGGGSPSFTPFAGADPVQTGAGIALGVLGYFVLINYLKGGAPQVRQWFMAKFFNKTSSTTNAQGQTPSAPSGGSTAAPPGMKVV